MRHIGKTITVPSLVEWVENSIRSGEYPGIRSLSGLVEYPFRKEMERKHGAG
ncbi:MAG: hypothetical protein QW566_06840 [Candidatus Jordarchaeales archaeon]